MRAQSRSVTRVPPPCGSRACTQSLRARRVPRAESLSARTRPHKGPLFGAPRQRRTKTRQTLVEREAECCRLDEPKDVRIAFRRTRRGGQRSHCLRRRRRLRLTNLPRRPIRKLRRESWFSARRVDATRHLKQNATRASIKFFVLLTLTFALLRLAALRLLVLRRGRGAAARRALATGGAGLVLLLTLCHRRTLVAFVRRLRDDFAGGRRGCG